MVISFLFWRLIREPLISLGRIGCLNFHPAPLPDFRGLGGYNVAILEGLREWGVSCHFVDEGFDTGDLVEVERFADRPRHRDGLLARPRSQERLLGALQAGDAARAGRRGAAARAAGRGPLRDPRGVRAAAASSARATTSSASCGPSGTRPARALEVEVDGREAYARGRAAAGQQAADATGYAGLDAGRDTVAKSREPVKCDAHHIRRTAAGSSLAAELRGLRYGKPGGRALLHVLRRAARSPLRRLRHRRAAGGALLHELRAPSSRRPAPARGRRPRATCREERRQVTVLFADLSGYTAVAERMDPEAVKALVDRALMRLGHEVERHGGTVDKYIGDNVMAHLRRPGRARGRRRARGPRRARPCRTRWTRSTRACPDGVHFDLRVGMNTGEVLAGAVGEAYTVVGDTVNVAARLQSAARPAA